MKQSFLCIALLMGTLIPTITVARAQRRAAAKRPFSRCDSLVIPRSLTQIKKNPELTLVQSPRTPFYVWQKTPARPFTELILSWNASRPKKGCFLFLVNIKHAGQWSGWRKLAEWGVRGQRTFCNTRNRFVHIKHVRAEMQKGRLGRAYKIKVVAQNGADLRRMKALFVNTANWKRFHPQQPRWSLPSTYVKDVPKQSQFWLKHKRTRDLCSPTSVSMVARYFADQRDIPQKFSQLGTHTAKFANRVRDHSIDIFGNWLFNVAQAFNTTRGEVLYRVERLNNFESLHKYLEQKIPVAVSIRGRLRGCAWPYNNGHFVVVVGWNKKNRTVACIDPAFRSKQLLVRHYRITDFVRAWGKSRNLSYVSIPKKGSTSHRR